MSPSNVMLTTLVCVAFGTRLMVGWYGYLAKGTAWYATDQFVPLHAIVVCVLAVALFFTLFRISRLLQSITARSTTCVKANARYPPRSNN